MAKRVPFIPAWSETAPPAGSYRSILKWGAPGEFKHPNAAWYELMKQTFGLSDADFQHKRLEGLEQVALADAATLLESSDVAQLRQLVGAENVAVDAYSRLKYSRGKSVEEAIELRSGALGPVTDAVVHPRSNDDVRAVVAHCHARKLPVYVYGGGSSVTLGLRPQRGGVTLALGTHMNRVLSLNEHNQTVRVQAGMLGPAYESALNRAPELFGTKLRYTGGHFPQSFEYSSVGGWVVTLGSGQASTYYGDAYDLVLAQHYVTPAGDLETHEYPATATGPKLNDIMKGSEGSFGVLVELTLKIRRYMPEHRRRFAFMFPSWSAAVDASRELMQSECGQPAVFRISDPEETELGLQLFGAHGTPADSWLRFRHFAPMQRSLLIGTSEGERGYAKHVAKQVAKLARERGAMSLTGHVTRLWERTRFKEPYMREDLQDYGIVIDTLETGVSWDGLHRLHRGVRELIKRRPRTLCMTHASHFYPQGTNLYFIYIMRPDSTAEYLDFQRGVIDAILEHGGSLSHHHGVGRLLAPRLQQHLGTAQLDVLRALKRHFDPHGIMNPGGILGLD